MNGHPVTVTSSPVMTAAELASALARRDLGFRSRVVQVMLSARVVRHPLPDDVAENVATFAGELGCRRDGRRPREFAAGSLGPRGTRLQANGYEGTWNEADSATALHSTQVLHDAWAFSADDPELSPRGGRPSRHCPRRPRSQGVGDVPGPRVHLPGTRGSAPPLLAQHDWVHVLADYGTTVESEVEVFGLIARANDDMHACSLLAMVISLFETGYLATGAGLFEASPGHFSSSPQMAVRLSDAMRRGACAMRRDGVRQH